jgi:hypothetical protein
MARKDRAVKRFRPMRTASGRAGAKPPMERVAFKFNAAVVAGSAATKQVKAYASPGLDPWRLALTRANPQQGEYL